MRDITRGGLSSTLYELAVSADLSCNLSHMEIPIRGDVQAACDLLGLEPMQCACEGRFILILPAESAHLALEEFKPVER